MLILVTGAAGFIGSNLCKVLLNRNDTVIGIDNLNDYYDVNLKYYRLDELKKHSNFTFIKMDLKDKESIDKLFEDYSFDVVVNLGAQAGVRYSIINPQAYMDSLLLNHTSSESLVMTELKQWILY